MISANIMMRLAVLWKVMCLVLAVTNGEQLEATILNPLFYFDNRLDKHNDSHFVTFSASKEKESVHFRPASKIPIYGQKIEDFIVYRNGLIALDNSSFASLSAAYPANTKTTSERLQTIDGRYLSVFSSVSSGASGKIVIKEYTNPMKEGSFSCLNRKQIERFRQIIKLVHPDEEEFQIQSVISIVWANMTCDKIDGKNNSYAVVILTNGERSYAIFQYWKIEWPHEGMSPMDAMAPEAGIFMRPLGGYQLPRSGHSVEPVLWQSESNVASPGEWLVPLVDTTTDPSPTAIPMLQNITIDSLNSFEKACSLVDAAIMPVPAQNDAASSIVESLNDTTLTITESQSETNLNTFVLHNDTSSNGIDAQNDQFKHPTNNTDEASHIDYDYYEHDPENNELQNSGLLPYTRDDGDEVIEPLIKPDIYTPLGRGRSQSNSRMCDARSECTIGQTECYTVEGRSCCACMQGYFGLGTKECLSELHDHKFNFIGDVKVQVDPSSSPVIMGVYLDIQHGMARMSSSGVRGSLQNGNVNMVLRLVTPMFHVLNALVASSCQGTMSSHPENRVFSLYTLSGALYSPLSIKFHFDVPGVGRLLAEAIFERTDNPHGPYSTDKIELSISSADGRPIQITKAYRETENQNTQAHFAVYHVESADTIVFREQVAEFVAEQPTGSDDNLEVRWSATATVNWISDYSKSGACMLRPGSPVPRNKPFYIRLGGRGYCNEDCSAADGSCSFFCLDEPLLFANEPNACDCITCERDYEECVVEGSTYQCKCMSGYKRMDDHTCRVDERASDMLRTRERCGMVECHAHGRCIDSGQSFCQCLPGYQGDGISHCDDDPCSRCRRNEVCINRTCMPTGANLCEAIRCGEQAFCQDGACICNPGYTGDPSVRCIQERDLCAGVKCHQFGQCYENRCYCSYGYTGDGLNFCDPRTEDACQNVRCANYARCNNGHCTCDPGYEGDGHHECRPIMDKCANIQCQPYARCEDGYCRCIDGYEEVSHGECREKQDPCSNVRCHQYATCNAGRCQCINGYEGDGYFDCQRRTEPEYCVDSRCHPDARCVGDRCECNPGFEGDGHSYCRPSMGQCGECVGKPFQEMAQCISGRCVCAAGFVKKDDKFCVECINPDCHPNATCKPNPQYNNAFSCQCNTGFLGDGINECRRDNIVPSCDGKCFAPNTYCDQASGQCVCAPGFDGDPLISCAWSCSLCHINAQCDRVMETCTCLPGYYGDGTTHCGRKPVYPEPVQVHISPSQPIFQVTDLDKPLELSCLVTSQDDTITGLWIQPTGSQKGQIVLSRLSNGTLLHLKIARPALADAGIYICRAGNAEAQIDVQINENVVAYDIFLTSDDGILSLKSSNKNMTTAKLWNIAENNVYARVAMVTDCNSKNVIYTSDYGKSIRSGNAKADQKNLTTTQIYTSQLSLFRNLAVDPPSGNIYAWDQADGKIVVLNPTKPQMKHTLENLVSLEDVPNIRFAGIAIHSNKGLLYWATYIDQWMPNGTIQVAALDGDDEQQLLQLHGEPLTISFAPSEEADAVSAGRLCWFQRTLSNSFTPTTELHCARLSADGRSILMQEKLRGFGLSEQPSWGMTQHGNNLLWTDAVKTVYHSNNPRRQVHVRHVCCSNRFQAIAVLTDCPSATINTCSYSNGRCRHFCLPGENQRKRTCVCPDSEPGCHKEL